MSLRAMVVAHPWIKHRAKIRIDRTLGLPMPPGPIMVTVMEMAMEVVDRPVKMVMATMATITITITENEINFKRAATIITVDSNVEDVVTMVGLVVVAAAAAGEIEAETTTDGSSLPKNIHSEHSF